MRTLLTSIVLIAISGCGNPFEFDPAITVILKITGVENEAQKERLKEKAEELVLEGSTYRKTQMSQHAETLMIKLAPVDDVQAFADRITFGKVTSVDGRTIHVTVGDDNQKKAANAGDDQAGQGEGDAEG